MAFPKAGSRRISVDGVAYCWRIRRKPTRLQADYGSGRLHVAVQLASAPGTILVLFTDRPHPGDWATSKVTPVLPSDIAMWVRQAIALGWQPRRRGAQAYFRVKDNAIEKVIADEAVITRMHIRVTTD
jgi:hypothetical protein